MNKEQPKWEEIIKEAIRNGHFNDTHGMKDVIYNLLNSVREEIVREIKDILDIAESDKEMADNPEDPKIRINYLRAKLDEVKNILLDK